jgi:hypothetical protein
MERIDQEKRIIRIESTLIAIYDALPPFIRAFVAQSPAGSKIENMRADLKDEQKD